MTKCFIANSMLAELKKMIRFLQKKVPHFWIFKFICAAFLVSNTFWSFGQQVSSIVPSSPTVGTLKQFGDYPMDYSTGTVNISVPIHTIQVKDFSIPINMSFNARGRMGNLNYSPLGVGWALTCIDYITREINGKPDDYATNIEQTKESLLNIGSGPDYNNLYHELYEKIIRTDPEITTYNGSTITYPSYDAIPDVYSYSINGRTGKYIINLNDKIIPLTFSTLKFSLGMEVIDERGNRFFFGGAPSAVENTQYTNVGNQIVNIASTWYLSKIITASSDTVIYNYESVNTGLSSPPIQPKTADYRMYTYTKFTSGDPLAPNPLSGNNGSHETQDVTSYSSYVMALLKSIEFPTGRMELYYGSTNKKLDSIKIFNTANQVYKKAEFTYINTPGASFIANNNSISLANVKIKGKDNSTEEQYSFEYYNSVLSYSGTNYQQKFLRNTDWWGYCNAVGENPPVIPGDTEFTGGQVGSKDANEQMKLNGMLKKITYPTGGTTEFVFENNKCFSNENNGQEIINGPGLRIKEIKSSSGNGTPLIKRIKYGQNENGAGTIPYIPNPEDFRSQLTYSAYFGGWNSQTSSHYLKKTYTPFPTAYVSKLYCMPVYYSYVTEYQLDTLNNSLGKTEYFYSTPSLTTVAEDNYLKYTAVKEWTQSQLREKKIYKSVGAGYAIQEHTTISYTDLNYINIPGINFIRKVELWLYYDPSQTSLPSGKAVGTTDEELYSRDKGGLSSIYTIVNHPIESAISVKTSEQVVNYEGGGSIAVIKNYEYQNLTNALPTKEILIGSDGILKESRFRYTSDVATTGDVYSNMISDRNMVSTLIDQTDFVGGVQAKYIRTNYFSPFTNLFVPQNIVVKNGNGPQYTFHEFKKYNSKGGILEQQSKDGLNEVYFWGYREQLPIVKLLGTDYITALTKITQAQINSVTNIENNDANVRALLNNLRIISGSMVTTFTYDPLTGMTSQSDINNHIIYYDYDSFGRLKTIRDQDMNVLKTMDYQYQQPYNQ